MRTKELGRRVKGWGGVKTPQQHSTGCWNEIEASVVRSQKHLLEILFFSVQCHDSRQHPRNHAADDKVHVQLHTRKNRADPPLGEPVSHWGRLSGER